MISRFFPLARQSLSGKRFFATATLNQVNYYQVLGVESGATLQQIHKAYTAKLQSINPALNQQLFKSVSEAFVILTNNKSRDAYDSLLRAKSVSYINDAEIVKPQTRSYIADRKEEANRLIRKKMNIDEFGRYKGGLPQKSAIGNARFRKGAANEPGELATRADIESYADRYPEYNIVDSEIAESFKNFHQSDRRDRTMKEPWFNLEVDYDYFTFKTFREQYLPWIRWAVVLGFAVPVLWVFIDAEIKKYEEAEIKTHGQSTKEH